MRENNANPFLLRMANLLIFIHNGRIEKLLYSPNFKMALIFLVTKVFQNGGCSNEFMFHSHNYEMLCHAMVSDKVMCWPECVQPPPPPRKIIL